MPVVALWRARRSRSLDEVPAGVGADAPLVSVVIPARNEARNIRRCVESALASDYPALEVIVVDDHSTDDTGAVAREIATRDARVRVTVPPPLPDDWFGKQWACHHGARAAYGDVVAFFDADTWQAPDLLPRAVNMLRSHGADLVTVGGEQELGSFWERLVQPQVFAVMLMRYGGTEVINESRRAADKIANGQCMIFRRAAYDAIGGHASVKHKVAEDLALAQHLFLTGHHVIVVLGIRQLKTRMYTSLRELVHGWGKNLYAGGLDAMPLGAAGRALYPLLLLFPALSGLVPPVLLVLALAGVFGKGVLVWAAIVTAVNLVWWLVVKGAMDVPPAYALLYPLGAATLLYIALRAIGRGNRVQWKEREYLAG